MNSITDKNICRKHLREDDDELYEEFESGKSGKRMRLDSIFEGLSLSGEKPTNSRSSGSILEVHPSLKLKYSISKAKIRSDKVVEEGELNSFIASKLYSHFRELYSEQGALIPWYSPYWIIIYHFQRWVLRLFNRFYRKYHQRIGAQTVKPFRDFGSLLDMVNSPSASFGWPDLQRVLAEEGRLEWLRLQKRMKSRLQKRKKLENDEFSELTRDLSYNYWDKLKYLGEDVNMFDYEGQDQRHEMKIEELVSDTESMEIDE
ncbi:hypothetical protein CAAN1_02S08966 [[Candida] anglica]|uniref:Uncharacterized protein n=1 Tax=[Candida] anglica TaxID=148631 RepID=A0ABP0EBU9_9ASCO